MMEQVEQFRYLGSLTLEDGYCEKDIRSRIEIVKRFLWIKRDCLQVQVAQLWQRNRASSIIDFRWGVNLRLL